jgi:hypothetical protein
MNIAQTFGESIKSLPVDTKNVELPNNTIDLLTNLFTNLKAPVKQTSSENYAPVTNPSQNVTQPSNVKNKTSVFSYIKVTLLLTILYIILSLETVKNLITKLTNNHIFTYITTSIIFIMVTFCSIKFML